MSQELIFTTNNCKRTSKFACIQVADLDTSPGRMSPGNILQERCHFGCIIIPLTEQFLVQKMIMARITNCLFFQKPHYTLGLVGSQDCKLLHHPTAFPHHSYRLPGPFRGQKLKSLLLVSKKRKVAKAKGMSFLIVLFPSYRGISTTESHL